MSLAKDITPSREVDTPVALPRAEDRQSRQPNRDIPNDIDAIEAEFERIDGQGAADRLGPLVGEPTSRGNDTERHVSEALFNDGQDAHFDRLARYGREMRNVWLGLVIAFWTIVFLAIVSNVLWSGAFDLAALLGLPIGNEVGVRFGRLTAAVRTGPFINQSTFALFTFAVSIAAEGVLYGLFVLVCDRKLGGFLVEYFTPVARDRDRIGERAFKGRTAGRLRDRQEHDLLLDAQAFIASFRSYFWTFSLRAVLSERRRLAAYAMAFVPLVCVAALALFQYENDFARMKLAEFVGSSFSGTLCYATIFILTCVTWFLVLVARQLAFRSTLPRPGWGLVGNLGGYVDELYRWLKTFGQD